MVLETVIRLEAGAVELKQSFELKDLNELRKETESSHNAKYSMNAQ
jgi:hypothetical protein